VTGMTEKQRITQELLLNGIVEKEFFSKKNKVQRVRLKTSDNEIRRFVIKKHSNPDNAAREAGVLKALQGRLAVPNLVDAKENYLILDFVSGLPLAEWLEQEEKRTPEEVSSEAVEILHELALWLREFYQIMGQLSQAGMIMGDVNLRNFLVNDSITGLDFEEVRPGKISEDAANIAAFIRLYHPEDTLWKKKLADAWLRVAEITFSLAYTELSAGMEVAIGTIRQRRSKKQ
jgi:tRNA A-37 threonylcarbamoyl transferase component Bud32